MHPEFVVEKSITNIVVILHVLCINLRCSAVYRHSLYVIGLYYIHNVVTSCGYYL